MLHLKKENKMKKAMIIASLVIFTNQGVFAADDIPSLKDLALNSVFKYSSAEDLSEILKEIKSDLELPAEVQSKIEAEIKHRLMMKALKEVNEAIDVLENISRYKARASWDQWFKQHSEIGISRNTNWELPIRFQELIQRIEAEGHPYLEVTHSCDRFFPRLNRDISQDTPWLYRQVKHYNDLLSK